jgi:hypothetical protein
MSYILQNLTSNLGISDSEPVDVDIPLHFQTFSNTTVNYKVDMGHGLFCGTPSLAWVFLILLHSADKVGLNVLQERQFVSALPGNPFPT